MKYYEKIALGALICLAAFPASGKVARPEIAKDRVKVAFEDLDFIATNTLDKGIELSNFQLLLIRDGFKHGGFKGEQKKIANGRASDIQKMLKPTDEDSDVKEPIIEKPFIEQPAVEEPKAEKPVIEDPTVKESTPKKPVEEKAVVKEQTPEEPVVEKPKKSGLSLTERKKQSLREGNSKSGNNKVTKTN